MKKYFVLTALSILTSTLAFGTTAYEALEVVRKARGDSFLNRLTALRGNEGDPQPASWALVIHDPATRNGFRELLVSKKQILSERTFTGKETAQLSTSPLILQQLNLDSDGVFRITTSRAIVMRIGFDTIEYELTTNPMTRAPLWEVRLYDYVGTCVGSLKIAANDGSILQDLQNNPNSPSLPLGSERKNHFTPTNDSSETSLHPLKTVLGHVENMARNVGEKISDTTVDITRKVHHTTTHTVKNLKNFFTKKPPVHSRYNQEDD